MTEIQTHAFLVSSHTRPQLRAAVAADSEAAEELDYLLRMQCWQRAEAILGGLQLSRAIDGYLPSGLFAGIPEVVMGAVDPDSLLAQLESWRMKPLRRAMELFRQVRAVPPGCCQLFLDTGWIEKMFEGDTTGEDLQILDRVIRLTSGVYSAESGFFSELDGAARMSRSNLERVHADPSAFALIFVQVWAC
jgi:hypothetical protein